MSVRKEDLLAILDEMARQMALKREWLSELDREIGDGDHGINMDRGFSEAMKKRAEMETQNPSAILRSVGMSLAFKVGGASGPLYGTAFMKASEVVADRSELELNDLLLMLEAAISGIKQRGKALRGEKTMLDSLEPALDSLRDAKELGLAPEDALRQMLAAAEQGAEDTKKLIATKGRASYVGERSLGHMDPGAASSVLLLRAICGLRED